MFQEFTFDFVYLSEYVKYIQYNNEDMYKNFVFDNKVINIYKNEIDYFILYNVNLNNSMFKNIQLQYLKLINTRYDDIPPLIKFIPYIQSYALIGNSDSFTLFVYNFSKYKDNIDDYFGYEFNSNGESVVFLKQNIEIDTDDSIYLHDGFVFDCRHYNIHFNESTSLFHIQDNSRNFFKTTIKNV